MVVIAAVVVVVAALIVADVLARQYATGYVRDRIIEVLRINPGTPVDVDLGPGSILAQAAGGALATVTIRVDELRFGELTGSAVITAVGVPLDAAQPVDGLGIDVTISEENVKALSSFLSGVELSSVELEDGVIRAGTDLDLLFLQIPVVLDLLPSASGGGIAFAPTSIRLGEQQISVADLQDNPQFSAIAGGLLGSREVCIAGAIPAALAVDDVEVVGRTLVVSINGDGTALGDPALSTLGVCPEPSP